MGGLLVVPCRYPPVFFQLADKTFDSMTRFMPFPIYLGLDGTAFPEGNYRLQSGALNLPTQRVTIASFVAHDRA